ncbi:hypothetical protein H8S10_04585 [Clostridium sp. NSJ-49]|nr:hypothetical protein [Clostridium sp. NSJ-49]MBC5624731.1 hypothetical protein [Clostridium sp. NSJ-49]
MSKTIKIITVICLIIILLTLRIRKVDDTITVQFGIWQLVKDYLNK